MRMNTIKMVAEFHKTFRHPILTEPQIPNKLRAQLRVDLLAEELKELQEAIDNNDLVEVADALCDLQYVLSGAILEFGLGDKFPALFAEVHRSNMSKACTSQAQAQETVSHYKTTKDTDALYEEVDGLFLVYRAVDAKTLKSINYSPADLKSCLNK